MSPKYTKQELLALRKERETEQNRKDDSKRNKRDKKKPDDRPEKWR